MAKGFHQPAFCILRSFFVALVNLGGSCKFMPTFDLQTESGQRSYVFRCGKHGHLTCCTFMAGALVPCRVGTKAIPGRYGLFGGRCAVLCMFLLHVGRELGA